MQTSLVGLLSLIAAALAGFVTAARLAPDPARVYAAIRPLKTTVEDGLQTGTRPANTPTG